MTLDNVELAAIGALVGAVGAGLWKGLVKIADTAKEIMAQSNATMTAIGTRYEEAMKAQNQTAIQTAVAMKDQADANRQLADAVKGIGARLEQVEKAVGEHDKAITGKFDRPCVS